MAVLTAAEFADKLCIDTIRWELIRNQQVQNLGNGEVLSSDIGPAYWQARISLVERSNNASAEIEAIIESLSGTSNAFLLYDPRKQYPLNDGDGSELGIAIVRLNSIDIPNAELSLNGLPAGYVLGVGDLMSFGYGTPNRVALHRITNAATASGAGITPLFSVSPQIRTGAAVNDIVALIRPPAKMVMVPNSLRVSSASSVTSRITFSARQTLRAD